MLGQLPNKQPVCDGCGRVAEDCRVPVPEAQPLCPDCRGLLRPDVVWFGESLPVRVSEEAWAAAERCRLMPVVGTSAVVRPTASLPLVALRNGARLVEVDPAETCLSAYAHEVLRDPAAELLHAWWEGTDPG